ncbi:unnamed protein product, partial [Ectocarpus sp. 13 AM-2016]
MFSTTPYVIRAVRLVVAYNRKYRLKYARFVKRNYALGFWAVACMGLTIRAGMFFGTDPAHYSSDMRECFYWDDIILAGAVLLFGAAPMSCLAIRISRVNDAFKIREELCCVFIGCSCCVAVLWVIQVLVELEIWPNTSAFHVVVEVQALLVGMNSGISGLLLPMIARNPEDEQFNCFLHILNHYLLPTSPDEINVSSAMHKRIAPFRTR